MKRLAQRGLVMAAAAALAVAVGAVLVEIWVRVTWNPARGVPGFYEFDPVRGQKLAAGYRGTFAGIPVAINALGFRDPREYHLDKLPGTFRIVVLGDSVTFGHGSVFEHTYPYLLEQELSRWRSDVNWQVWNLGVPGYNTRQELEYLREVGSRFAPDLVVVGFFPNDVVDNHPAGAPGPARILASRILSVARRHWYSLEWYRRTYLTLRWRLGASEVSRQQLSALEDQDRVLPEGLGSADAPEQQLTPIDRRTPEDVAATRCPSGSTAGPEGVEAMEHDAEWRDFVDAVRGLQTVGARIPVVFFINYAPPTCPDTDVFYDGGSSLVNAKYLEVMGRGTPAVSVHDALLALRPSQMPNAGAHALGNANAVKAGVLAEFLEREVLPPLLARF